MLFLIGEEVKSETEPSFDTAVIDGKVYRLYAMQSIDLEKSKVSEGSWKVANKRFDELGKAPAAGKQAGFVIGTVCDGDAELTFSNIRWFKVPKDSSAKLTLKKVNIRKSAKKLTLSATLKINGKAAKNKTVIFRFKKKNYKAKTNKKGVAKVTIKKSALKKLRAGTKVTYKVKYSTKTIAKTVKVKK